MRILLAEDDRFIADGLGRSLRQTGYAVDWVANGPDADHALLAGAYDLVILDLGLPKMSGLEVLRRLRARASQNAHAPHNAQVPVLILTALDGTSDRVKGLDLGADDYMAKPFELPELEARVRALTRRSTATPPLIQFGPLAFDQSNRCALLDGQLLDLSARELGLLEILMLRAGRLVSKDQLVDHLCGWGEEVSHNAIEVYVHRLRKKLETSGATITTVRGLGYCFEKSAPRS
jgi:two-component system OmpR family response regulator